MVAPIGEFPGAYSNPQPEIWETMHHRPTVHSADFVWYCCLCKHRDGIVSGPYIVGLYPSCFRCGHQYGTHCPVEKVAKDAGLDPVGADIDLD